jgi:hypothetical protein
MLLHYLKFKFTIFYRFIKEDIGLFYFTFFLLLIIYIYLVFYGYIQQYILYFGLAGIIRYHLTRTDIDFLKVSCGFNNYKIYIIAEYLLLSAPFIILSFFLNNYFTAIFLIMLPAVIANVNFLFKIKSSPIYFPFDIEAFEWIPFIRGYLIFYLLGLIFLFIPYFIELKFFFIILNCFFVLLIYSNIEPLTQILVYRHLTPSYFLIKKIKLLFKYFFLLAVCPLLLFDTFHVNILVDNNYYTIHIVYLLSSAVFLISVIFIKYAYFKKPIVVQFILGVLLAILLAVFLNPAYSLLLFLSPIFFYKKAIQTLNKYFSVDN